MSDALKKNLALCLAIFLALTLAFFVAMKLQPSFEARPARKGLHAVFLTNGQVYFGSIAGETDRRLRLENIYYFQTRGLNANDQLNTQSDVTLQKLGSEIHGPEDWMEIHEEQILFIEKLKEDGKVAKAIREYKGK